MAVSHGRSAVFKLDASVGGALTAYTAYLNSVTFTPKGDMAETSVFAIASKTYVAGLKDGTFSLKGPYDPVMTAVYNAGLGAAATLSFEYDPQGTASGTDKWTGEAFCTSIGISTDLSGAAMLSAEFQISGAITLATN